MRARVVSVKTGSPDGTFLTGVEFVGEEAAWDLEFPVEWTDYFNRPEETAAPASSGPSRQAAGAEDRALEGMLRKAQALRASAESMLAEYAAQVDGARRQNTSVLAAQVEEFHAWKSILETESASQFDAAKKALESERERARQQMELDTAEVTRKIQEIAKQGQAALAAGEELFNQLRVRESQKNISQVARITAQLEAQRKAMQVLEEQAAEWRQQSSAHVAALDREFQALQQKVAAEMQSGAANAVTEFRKRIPAMSEELEQHFGAFLEQQKLGATAWLEQAGKNFRSGSSALEQDHRAALDVATKKALDDFSARFSERMEEFRKTSESVAEPLEARQERMRKMLEEMAAQTESLIERARHESMEAVEKAAEHLKETSAARVTAVTDAEAAARKRLDLAGEALISSAHDTHRRVDQMSLDLEALGAKLHQQSAKNRADLETQFATLLAMYDNRKAGLDKLVETIETGRATLRDGLELLRVNREQHQARLQSFTADQEASLRSRTAEMEQRLAAALLRMEGELRAQASASLDAAHQGFVGRLDTTAGESHKRFAEIVDQHVQGAATRIPELVRELDRTLEQHSGTLAADLTAHQQAMARARENFEQLSRDTADRLREQHERSSNAAQTALTAALAAVEDRQASAATAIGSQFKEIQQQREEAARQHAAHEQMVQKWRLGLETEFKTLSAKLDEKRVALDAFYALAEQNKAAWVKHMGAIDRRIEDARNTIAAQEKQALASMGKHSEGLGEHLLARLRQSLDTAQTELSAVTEAAESVFQARINDFAQQSLKSTERQLEQGANSVAMSLDRTMQKERRENERQAEELSGRFHDQLREQLDNYRASAGQAAADLRIEMQKICVGMLDQVKEAREELARHTPTLLAEAEESFRRALERVQERTLQSTSEELRMRASQWKARAEMGMSTPEFEAVAGKD